MFGTEIFGPSLVRKFKSGGRGGGSGGDSPLVPPVVTPLHKEADWAQRKLGTISVRKTNNSFRFIDDLLSLNDNSTFEKHYKDIYPTDPELKKENNTNSCASFLDI